MAKSILEQIAEYRKMKSWPPYWNVEKDGTEYDYEAESLEAVQEFADRDFAEQILDDTAPRNGAEFEEDVVFIKYEINRESGEYEVKERVPGKVFYEHYHGDYAEHNTMGM